MQISLKSFFICFLFTALTCTVQAEEGNPTEAEPLYQLGEHALAQGQPQQALNYWGDALKAYEQQAEHSKIRLIRIAQTRAAHQLGHYRDACEAILRIFEVQTQNLCTPHAKATFPRPLMQTILAQPQGNAGLLSLGTSLEHLGKYESAISIYQALLNDHQALDKDRSTLALSLANIYRSQFQYAHNRYELGDQNNGLRLAKTSGIKSFESYKALFDNRYPDIALAAKVNALLLAADLAQWTTQVLPGTAPEFDGVLQAQPNIASVVEQLKTADFQYLPPILAIQSRLKLADSLLKIMQAKTLPNTNANLELAYAQANLALQQAHLLENSRALSQAAGVLGKIYLQSDKSNDAYKAFDYARSQAISIRASDLAYEWEWHQAQLEPDIQRALKLYASAIDHIDAVRTSLYAGTIERQSAFQIDITPIYQGYMVKLLELPQPNLGKVLQIHDQLQIAELESFLQCGRLSMLPAHPTVAVSPSVTVYILDLGQSIEVIVRSVDNTLRRFSASADRVKSNARKLQNLIQNQFNLIPSSTYLPISQALYHDIISPIEAARLISPKDNLVFRSDYFLQNIPITLLHDSNQFLIQKYAVSNEISPYAEFKPKSEKPYALLMGLSESPNMKFAALTSVQTELNEIAETLPTKTLLNQQFTLKSFKQQIESSNAPIMHISTHGQFSSDRDQTFLLAWDQPINFDQLDHLFRTRPRPLDLLFLSACQTAKGDLRSALGLAGLTVRSGASSTIASLWQINEESTTQLVQTFYNELASGKTRADSLRKAQLKLMSSNKYAHPYYWAAFILIGNWL